VKLLGNGELKAKVNFAVHGASKSAIEAVSRRPRQREDPGAKKEVDEERAARTSARPPKRLPKASKRD